MLRIFKSALSTVMTIRYLTLPNLQVLSFSDRSYKFIPNLFFCFGSSFNSFPRFKIVPSVLCFRSFFSRTYLVSLHQILSPGRVSFFSLVCSRRFSSVIAVINFEKSISSALMFLKAYSFSASIGRRQISSGISTSVSFVQMNSSWL